MPRSTVSVPPVEFRPDWTAPMIIWPESLVSRPMATSRALKNVPMLFPMLCANSTVRSLFGTPLMPFVPKSLGADPLSITLNLHTI